MRLLFIPRLYTSHNLFSPWSCGPGVALPFAHGQDDRCSRRRGRDLAAHRRDAEAASERGRLPARLRRRARGSPTAQASPGRIASAVRTSRDGLRRRRRPPAPDPEPASGKQSYSMAWSGLEWLVVLATGDTTLLELRDNFIRRLIDGARHRFVASARCEQPNGQDDQRLGCLPCTLRAPHANTDV